MASEKQVKVKVATESDLKGVEAIEDKINKIKQEKIQLQLNAKAEQLDEVNQKIDSIKKRIAEVEAVPPHIRAKVDDDGVEALKAELASLESKSAQLTLDVEKGELEQAKSEVEDLDGKNIELNLAMENFSQGISQAKQGISELKGNVEEVSQAGIQAEQNFAFLEMNLGAEKAKEDYQAISDIVASMPGDDNTMRSVLSTAQALGNDLKPEEMKEATKTMADYMAGSRTMGKMATESQQDIMKYLLDGNTAELERGSIVSAYVDKLKDANTFMERQAAMQEVLNELGYGGLSQQDTLANKQLEYEGMIYNSQVALSNMWMEAEKGAIDYIVQLDGVTHGFLGMGIVASQMVAGPLVSIMSGISQIGMGLKTLKDAADFTGITGKLGALKTALINAGSAAKTAAMNFLTLAKNALIAGYNALKSAAMWVVQKVQLIASTAATYAMAAAQALLNLIMSLNPITLVVIAIIALIAVLAYLYYNVDWVRQAIDNLGASIISTAQWIYSGFMQIVTIVSTALSNAWNSITMFCSNIVTGLTNAAMNAVNGFMNYISQLPNMVMTEFNRVLGLVGDFISSIPSRVWEMGTAIINALKSALGIGSPGHMFYMVEGEFNRIDDLTKKTRFDTSSIGQSMVENFNPNLNGTPGVAGGMNNNITINIDNVDSEERVNEIVEAVRKALSWDNRTAGRTV